MTRQTSNRRHHPTLAHDRVRGNSVQPNRAARLWLIILLLAVCGGVIVGCRLGLKVSIVSTHFVYVPIVLTGVWWGKRAIWAALFFAALVLSVSPFASTGEPLAADIGRAFCFVLVGFSVGAVSEGAQAARRAEEASRRELDSARERLFESERLASMGQLSAGVAHEINNPLGTVLLYSHVLLKQFKEGDSKRDDIQMILSEATRCKEIVRGLLDFARQSRVFKAPTDLAALIADVVSVAEPHAKQADARVMSDVPADLPMMMIDGTQIRQMLLNLVKNGIDAVRDEGRIRIAARLRPAGEAMEITVSDNGCGIPKEDLSKLFTPFFTTKEMGKGTGLGLAIAYGVVKMHSGDITVQSEAGKGTTFSVRLPLGHGDEAGNVCPASGRLPRAHDSGTNVVQEHAGMYGLGAEPNGPTRFPKGGTS